jgi:hypothetical protein
MSDLRIPNRDDDFVRMRKDVDDLLRRVPHVPGDQGGIGCCTAYCCLDDAGHTANTGEIVSTCEFDVEPMGGAGLRLELDGWIRVKVNATGDFGIVAFTAIDATTYDGAPKLQFAVVDGDIYTFPIGGTYDVLDPDPIVIVRAQNLSTVQWTIQQVYATLHVTEKDGSASCGHAHAGTGPL